MYLVQISRSDKDFLSIDNLGFFINIKIGNSVSNTQRNNFYYTNEIQDSGIIVEV